MPDPNNPHYDEVGVFYDSGFFYADGQPDNSTIKPKIPMAKLKQALSRRNAENLVALAELVLPKVAPTPPEVPPIAGVADEAADLATATTEAKAANTAWANAKVTLAALAVTRAEKADALRVAHANLGSALEVKSKGEAGPLTATGYDLAEASIPATTPPDKILNMAVTAGDNDASVDLTCDPDAKASSYEWQITTVHPVDGPYVTMDTTTASSTTIPGLTSGTRIWARVCGIGAKGHGPWSDPATKIVP